MHLVLFVQIDDYPHKRMGKYPHLVIGTSLVSKSTTIAICRPDNKQNRWKECEYDELRFRRGSLLAYGVMGFAFDPGGHSTLGQIDRGSFYLAGGGHSTLQQRRKISNRFFFSDGVAFLEA